MQILMNAVSTMEDVSTAVLTWKARLNVDVTVGTNSPAMEETALVGKVTQYTLTCVWCLSSYAPSGLALYLVYVPIGHDLCNMCHRGMLIYIPTLSYA